MGRHLKCGGLMGGAAVEVGRGEANANRKGASENDQGIRCFGRKE